MRLSPRRKSSRDDEEPHRNCARGPRRARRGRCGAGGPHDLETAKDDDPIFKRAVPTFAPGTHARRKTHHQLRLLGRSQTSDAANERSRNMLSFQRTRSGTNWIKGKSFKRLSGSHAGTRSDGLSPGSSPASTHSSVDLRRQHRGAFFRASVANLDA